MTKELKEIMNRMKKMETSDFSAEDWSNLSISDLNEIKDECNRCIGNMMAYTPEQIQQYVTCNDRVKYLLGKRG